MKEKTITQLKEYIESRQFSFSVTIQSGHRHAQVIIAEDKSVAALQALACNKPPVCWSLADRIRDLRARHRDPGYTSPFDAAIAAYVYILWRANYYALDDVLRIVSEDRALFYARRLAARILAGEA
jgi:hypothetical protein